MEILKTIMRDFRVKSMINICRRFFRNENRIIEKIRIPTNEIYSAKYPYGKDIENKSKISSSIQPIYSQFKTLWGQVGLCRDIKISVEVKK